MNNSWNNDHYQNMMPNMPFHNSMNSMMGGMMPPDNFMNNGPPGHGGGGPGNMGPGGHGGGGPGNMGPGNNHPPSLLGPGPPMNKDNDNNDDIVTIEDDTPMPDVDTSGSGDNRKGNFNPRNSQGGRDFQRDRRDRDRGQYDRSRRPDNRQDNREGSRFNRGRDDRNDRSDNRGGDRRRNDRSENRNRRGGRWGESNDSQDNMDNNMPPALMSGPIARPPGQMQGPGPIPPPIIPNIPNMQGGMMPGPDTMMPYGNIGNMMPMAPNMPMNNMGMPMQNMPNMMPGINMPMMPGVNMPMDPGMMYNQSMIAPNTPLAVTDAVLLPPLPGVQTPNRRDRPLGCRTLFAGGFPNDISESILREIFQYFGEINEIKMMKQGVVHVRFEKEESVEASFAVSGYRFKYNNQSDQEATTVFIDYAVNRQDQSDHERRKREPSPVIEPCTPANLASVTEKIKSDEEFAKAAVTLAGWLKKGECNKRNANTFYSLIFTSNNQTRRLFNEKMSLEEEYASSKIVFKDKFRRIIYQFEQVAKILTAAKHQRVSDHFSKQQRRNIEMWLKMAEEVENMREEFNANFNDDDTEAVGGKKVSEEKYEQIKEENDRLQTELEAFKNEAYMAKDEAERKFEKFKAHFMATQALQMKQGGGGMFPPLPPPPVPNMMEPPPLPKSEQPPTPDEINKTASPQDAKLVSILTAFLMIHPLGASLDNVSSYVRSLMPSLNKPMVQQVLQKFTDVFVKHTPYGSTVEKWSYVLYDNIKRGF